MSNADIKPTTCSVSATLLRRKTSSYSEIYLLCDILMYNNSLELAESSFGKGWRNKCAFARICHFHTIHLVRHRPTMFAQRPSVFGLVWGITLCYEPLLRKRTNILTASIMLNFPLNLEIRATDINNDVNKS